MNIASLNEQEIDIEKLSRQFEEDGYEKLEIKNWLNDHYRRFSQKGEFRCVCCNVRVDMVLSDEKVFHFRHYNKEECAYSENHKIYKAQRENKEDYPKHRAGKAILRTYLEGICKTKNIRLTDGYRFKSILSIVPDFILEFPNGQKWAIDYLTGLKSDQKYANSLAKRRETYIQNHFIPIFLFDGYWLAYEPEINFVSLVEGEVLCVKETRHDSIWTNFIRGLEPNLKNILLKDDYYHWQVNSMVYFSPHARKINIIRFLQGYDNPRNTRTVCKPINISLEKALLINSDQSDFVYTNENEDEYQEYFKKQLEQIYQQQENLRKQQEEERIRKDEAEKKKIEFARIKAERKKRAAQQMKENHESKSEIPFIGRSQKQMDADLKKKLEELQRNNKNSYWYKQMVTHMLENDDVDGNSQSKIIAPINEVEVALANLKKETNIIKSLSKGKFDEILNHYVNGEAYFVGGEKKWKEVVVNCFELFSQEKITIPQILQKIKEYGIEFSQSEKIMSYPVIEYMQYIRKKVK
ncbi:hypothetical protein AB1L07_20980 [Niallia alba]|uniref:hypothetical protein n=1 Tax=Niallia alba TaxID=2729105 RepID=UPI0039A3574F